jgi:UDP-2,3-diacylglucosamine pyrophosphatase LpxH
VRTLVVSDMHLGSRLGRDVLRVPAALDALLEAIDDVDRLVLLGEVVELLEGRGHEAMAAAEPVLRAIGARVGAEGEIVLVPGNHDAALVRGWVRSHRGVLTPDTELPPGATAALAQVVAWLGPGRVRIRYPGVWLSDGLWATHGHYLDRHLLPETAYGIGRGLLGRLPRDGATPDEYEQGGPSLTRIEASLTSRLPTPLARRVEDAAEALRARTMPRLRGRVLRRRTAPLTSRLLGAQMRRAALPALARVVHRLGVDADWVVFGHVHRCGPVAGDDLSEWAGPHGRPRIVNTGSWVYEARLLHNASAPHPYWPGGAVLIADGAEPQALGLLDHLDAAVLAPR